MFSKIKDNFFLRALYGIPGVSHLYHLSLAFLGALWYGFPSGKLTVIGVTGTKGKTTVVELLGAILRESGTKTALLSSREMRIGNAGELNVTGNTMPGRFSLQKFLSRALHARCHYAIVEVTSQGVLLSRHRFIRFKRVVLTNIHPEHIEAHGSFEKYRDTKMAFLMYARKRGASIFVYSKSPYASFIENTLRKEQLFFYSTKELPKEFYENTYFESEFGKENVAAAAAVARSLGIDDEAIARSIRSFVGVPGRMEFIEAKKGKSKFEVVIDYAHTPDSLKAVYETLQGRLKKPGRLICVLGSAGGGRDIWKRPAMGKIASAYCDLIFLTNEDPYDEDPARIVTDIEKGISKKEKVFTELDRRTAIRWALKEARSGDVVIVTGKGSETSIHVAQGKKIPWSEREVVREALRDLE